MFSSLRPSSIAAIVSSWFLSIFSFTNVPDSHPLFSEFCDSERKHRTAVPSRSQPSSWPVLRTPRASLCKCSVLFALSVSSCPLKYFACSLALEFLLKPKANQQSKSFHWPHFNSCFPESNLKIHGWVKAESRRALTASSVEGMRSLAKRQVVGREQRRRHQEEGGNQWILSPELSSVSFPFWVSLCSQTFIARAWIQTCCWGQHSGLSG